MIDAYYDHFSAVLHGNPLYYRKYRRFDLLDLCTHFFERVVAHLLADRRSFRRDAEKDAPTAMVKHGAHRLGSFAASSGGFLELQYLGLTGCN